MIHLENESTYTKKRKNAVHGHEEGVYVPEKKKKLYSWSRRGSLRDRKGEKMQFMVM